MSQLKPLFKKLWIIALILTVIVFWTEQVYLATSYEDSGEPYEQGVVSCNVADIKLEGSVYTYLTEEDSDAVSSADIVRAIEDSEKNNSIKAIILEIDSSGGYPVAGEEIANALRSVKKPTVAVIRQAGASAAYWASTGADRIFASSLSAVGSVGVSMSYLDNAKKNEKDGLTYNGLSSGKFKDTGDPDKILTEEEKQLLQRDVDIAQDKFISAVATNRNLDIEKVRTLADGSTMLGDAALANGLIDQIGGISEAREYLKGIIGEDAIVCKESASYGL